MSDLNIRNNLHVGVTFDVQGNNLVATATPESVGAAPTVHTHEMEQIEGLIDALASKQEVGGNFDTRYLRIDAGQSLSGSQQSQGRSNLGLGSAATLNAPASGDAGPGEVVLGDDSRLSGGGGGGTGAVYTDRGNVSGSVTVDLDGNNDVIQSLTLTGNTTISLTNVPVDYAVVTLLVTQDSTGSRTLSVAGDVTVLNGGDGSISPTLNSRSIVTLVTADGGSHWDMAVADPRANQLDDFYWNPQADGDYYIKAKNPFTLDLAGTTTGGTGSVAHAKSTDGSTFTAVSGITSFATGDIYRMTVSGFSDWFTVTIPRVS